MDSHGKLKNVQYMELFTIEKKSLQSGHLREITKYPLYGDALENWLYIYNVHTYIEIGIINIISIIIICMY